MALLSEEEYHHKMDNIVRSIGQHLRKVFKTRFWDETGETWIDHPDQVDRFNNGVGKDVYKRAQKDQKTYLKEKALEEWDVSLLSLAIQNFGSETSYKAEKENQAVWDIKKIRNSHMHKDGNKLSKERYEEMLEIVIGNLKILEVEDEEIEDLIEKAGVSSSEKAWVNVTTLFEKARKLISDGEIDMALECYSKALLMPSVLPENRGNIYEHRAQCYLDSAKNALNNQDVCSEAMLDIEKALQLNPHSWKAHYLAAKCNRLLGKLSEALHHFIRALAISPIQKQVKKEYNACKVMFGVQNRCDHLIPAFLPMSIDECLDQVKREIGLSIERKELVFIKEDIEGKLVKGQDHVNRGLRLVFEDMNEAAKSFSAAAKLGNAEGIYNLGVCYHYGKGVNPDFEKARKLYKQAAKFPKDTPGNVTPTGCNLGVAYSQHAIGLLYNYGIGVEHDYEQAVNCYKSAMKNGICFAANNLGILYSQGYGVEWDMKMAEMCWKEALRLGDVNAPMSLFQYYIHELEPDMAISMLEKGREMGNDALINLTEQEIQRLLERVKTDRANIEPQLVETEENYKLPVKGTTFRKRMLRLSPRLENLNRLSENCFDQSLMRRNWDKKHAVLTLENLPVIQERANLGSVVAMQICEMAETYSELEKIIKEQGTPTMERKLEIINLYYKIITIEPYLLLIRYNVGRKLVKIIRDMYHKKCETTGEDDMKIRVCYVFISAKNHLATEQCDVIEILKESLERYPDNQTIYSMLSGMLGIRSDYATGLFYAEQGLKKFQNDPDLLYAKAVFQEKITQTEISETTRREFVQAFQTFLEKAPKDHRKVPEAYYQISSIYITQIDKTKKRDEETLKLIEEYYQRGKEAERQLLPCYLPYAETDAQVLVKTILDFLNKTFNPVEEMVNKISSELQKNILERKEYLKNTRRQSIILEHRKKLSQNCKKTKACQATPEDEIIISGQQPVPKRLTQMKPITIQDMGCLTTNQVFENRMIDLTIIEDPLVVLNYISTIVEDENGDVIQLNLCNIETQDKDKLQMFNVGCRIALLNPQIMNNKMLNLEPKCLVPLAKAQALCRFCGEENSIESCKKCKRSYCSIECRKKDYKNHQLICSVKY